MSTIELYNALVKAGVEDSKAKAVSESLVTFDDAKLFATKVDIQRLEVKINMLTGMMLAINGAILVAILFK